MHLLSLDQLLNLIHHKILNRILNQPRDRVLYQVLKFSNSSSIKFVVIEGGSLHWCYIGFSSKHPWPLSLHTALRLLNLDQILNRFLD